MSELIDMWMNGQIDGWISKYEGGCSKRWVDGWTNRYVDGWSDGWVDAETFPNGHYDYLACYTISLLANVPSEKARHRWHSRYRILLLLISVKVALAKYNLSLKLRPS